MDEQYIGNKLKSLRQQKNMRQSDLAEALSVSTSTISHWEKGRRFPSVIEVKRIADYFQVDINVLINPSDDQSIRPQTRESLKPNIRNSYKPVKIPFLNVYYVIMIGLFALLFSSVFFQHLIGYVTYGLSLIALFLLIGFYTFRLLHDQKKASQEHAFLPDDTVLYRHEKTKEKIDEDRFLFLFLSMLSLIGLFLFFVFYVLLLLHMKMFVFMPFVITVMGMTVMTMRILIYRNQSKKNPYIPAIPSRDKRIQKGIRLVHLIMLIDMTCIILLLYAFLYNRLFNGETLVFWIALSGFSALLLDASVIYRYHHFTSAFNPVTQKDDASFPEQDEKRGVR